MANSLYLCIYVCMYQLGMEDETVKQHQTRKSATLDDQQQVQCDVKECLEGRVIRPGTSVKENERSQLVSRGSVQCQRCKRWFCSKGGLAVHRCKNQNE